MCVGKEKVALLLTQRYCVTCSAVKYGRLVVIAIKNERDKLAKSCKD